MKWIAIIIMSLTTVFGIGQADSSKVSETAIKEVKPVYRYKRRSQIFWDAEEGAFVGIENRYDLGTYSLGVVFKGYGSYYGLVLVNGSFYGGYNYLFDFEKRAQKLNHCVRAGVHFSLLGLETNVFFGKYDEFLWTIMPKIGIEWGHLSFFYGYHLPLINKSDRSWKQFHSVMLSYSVCITP